MKKTFLAVLGLMLFALSSQNVYACSCAGITQSDEFKRSESVFIGKFIRRTETGVELKITKSWKGAKAGKIIVLSYWDFDGCDYDIKFVRGKKFLIYAIRSNFDQKLWISLDCGRSRAVEDATEDIKNMGKVAKNK